MKAYDKGFADGKNNARSDRARKYQTNKLEKEYWRGYVDGMVASNPSKELMLVQCEREGKIFFADRELIHILCPTCGRTYIKNEDGVYYSDRKLTILRP